MAAWMLYCDSQQALEGNLNTYLMKVRAQITVSMDQISEHCITTKSSFRVKKLLSGFNESSHSVSFVAERWGHSR